jgi:multimeric flavodoxin WrbA
MDKNSKQIGNPRFLKAAFLLGTLKPTPGFSHTKVLCELLIEDFKALGVQSEIFRLVDYNIKPGLKSNMGKGDDWPKILEKIFQADILIFATPIWWGIQSSLIQRIIERMDELNDKLLETGESDFANKIGGIVITGAEDGAEHIIGNICNFMSWNGLTIPPACSLSWLGDASKETSGSLLKKFKNTKSTRSMSKVMAHNLTFFAKLLKQHPLPKVGKGIMSSISPGTVGMRV